MWRHTGLAATVRRAERCNLRLLTNQGSLYMMLTYECCLCSAFGSQLCLDC